MRASCAAKPFGRSLCKASKENPGSFLPGFIVQVIALRLPGAADAEVAGQDALILELVCASRLEAARPAACAVEPVLLWSSVVYMISPEKVRFLTGVHAVREPTCQMLKSGLQLLPAA
jgi:hypothetical protein